ncbi:helix-turn-helix transcriptional regulator [Sphingomonas sp. AR_OL41]|uniref:helix-turn-helix domain-containing protein n=1 Tax=Sphingomonas sp. AR_OL41 TaxID=3042729 RepID=UPI0024814857|nr:helix-turn-helix transcriptional regulator [Sphingomonas sp. AR_OL41]MDH7975706.1 helix-turn-helix transcriptional regulator [Sphingomonas sp. AR_OL41]
MAGAIYSEAQQSVARAFAAVRREKALKQSDLANLIGKHQSYISDIERGQRRVDILELYVIARAMKMTPVDLYARITADLPMEVTV